MNVELSREDWQIILNVLNRTSTPDLNTAAKLIEIYNNIKKQIDDKLLARKTKTKDQQNRTQIK